MSLTHHKQIDKIRPHLDVRSEMPFQFCLSHAVFFVGFFKNQDLLLFRKFGRELFTFTVLRSAGKLSNEHQIMGLHLQLLWKFRLIMKAFQYRAGYVHRMLAYSVSRIFFEVNMNIV